MKFNSAAFKAEWREICKDREVDPVEGATSFQVAAYKAEVTEKWRRHPFFARRWARPSTIQFWQEYEVMRGEVESADVYDVLLTAKRVMKKFNHGHSAESVETGDELIPVDVAIREIWQEVTREMRRDAVHKVPLRDLEKMPAAAMVVAV